MGIKHSSRCMLLRRKMAESESCEVSVKHLRGTFCFTLEVALVQNVSKRDPDVRPRQVTAFRRMTQD